MTIEEAQRILERAACHCDGLGVTPRWDGIARPCPDCDGKSVTNTELHQAMDLLRGDRLDS